MTDSGRLFSIVFHALVFVRSLLFYTILAVLLLVVLYLDIVICTDLP